MPGRVTFMLEKTPFPVSLPALPLRQTGPRGEMLFALSPRGANACCPFPPGGRLGRGFINE